MEDVDFVVIGGGIAGASVAYELAAHGQVVVLEREATAGYHTTGRSAALLAEAYGQITQRRLTRTCRPFLEKPPEGFTEVPLLAPLPVLFIGRQDQQVAMANLVATVRDLVPDVRAVGPDEARSMCPVLRGDYVATGALDPGGMSIDVHALHQGFLTGVRHRGGEIRLRAPVEGLQWAGDRWTVIAGEQHLRAPVVVNAAGAWCDEVAALAGAKPVGLVPMRRTAFTFPAPPDVDIAGWPMVVDVDEDFYFKPEGGQFLASPADETPMEPHDVRPEEIDVAAGIERIQAATTLTIRHVRSAWAGLRSFVRDRDPVVGMDAECPGFFWLAGQGGFGIMTSPAMARAATALIVDGRLPDDLLEVGLTSEALSPQRLR